MQALAIWITGFPASGKSTIAGLVQSHLKSKNIPVMILDGDEIRKTLSKDLGFSPEDRKEHNRRVIEITKLLVKNGITTITPLISSYRETREAARREIPNFVEVYTKASLDSLLLPSKILGRESQMVELVRYLLGYRYGRVVPFVSVYGRSGSGKTTVVQHVCNELKEAEYVLVNLRRARTVFGATNLILGYLGLETLKGSKETAMPFEKMGRVIENRLEKNGKKSLSLSWTNLM
jgi:adenylylsulfate kinase-like enzyme